MGWLDDANRILAGATPRSPLSTPEARQNVLTVLGRIEYGVFSRSNLFAGREIGDRRADGANDHENEENPVDLTHGVTPEIFPL